MRRKRVKRKSTLNRRRKYPKKRKRRIKKQKGKGFFSPLANMFKSGFNTWKRWSDMNDLTNVHVP